MAVPTPETVYQFIVPPDEVAANCNDPFPQREAPVTLVIVGVMLTVIAPVTVLVRTIPLAPVTLT